jgi:hypothetical protein
MAPKNIDPAFDEPFSRSGDRRSLLDSGLAGLRNALAETVSTPRPHREPPPPPRPKPGEELMRLRRTLPEQKLAPAQFEIRNGRLALKDVRSTPAPEDRNNVVAAREELKSGGERILRELERSNCDRRLIETVQLVQGLLSEEGNVIKLGIGNIQAVRCAPHLRLSFLTQ